MEVNEPSVLRVSFGPGSQLDCPHTFSDGLHKLCVKSSLVLRI